MSTFIIGNGSILRKPCVLVTEYLIEFDLRRMRRAIYYRPIRIWPWPEKLAEVRMLFFYDFVGMVVAAGIDESSIIVPAHATHMKRCLTYLTFVEATNR